VEILEQLEWGAKVSGPRPVVPLPRVTVTPEEASASLGVSRDFFDEHVKPELRLIRRGRLILIPIRELDRWADENAARVLE
jgi:excisionase family DNA binding protein